jgi:hypothetical protein
MLHIIKWNRKIFNARLRFESKLLNPFCAFMFVLMKEKNDFFFFFFFFFFFLITTTK